MFEEVVNVIAKYAFVRSSYPVVISLEVHCGFTQQGRMAEILTTILGE
jgi:phosphatidylinositol phospholipase C delta